MYSEIPGEILPAVGNEEVVIVQPCSKCLIKVESFKKVRKIINIATSLEGSARHLGKQWNRS